MAIPVTSYRQGGQLVGFFVKEISSYMYASHRIKTSMTATATTKKKYIFPKV